MAGGPVLSHAIVWQSYCVRGSHIVQPDKPWVSRLDHPLIIYLKEDLAGSLHLTDGDRAYLDLLVEVFFNCSAFMILVPHATREREKEKDKEATN